MVKDSMLTQKLKPGSTIDVDGPAKIYVVKVHERHVVVGVSARPEVKITFDRTQAHLEPVEAGEPSKEMD